MFDFRRATVFCLGCRLKPQNDYMLNIWWVMAPWPPVAKPMCVNGISEITKVALSS